MVVTEIQIHIGPTSSNNDIFGMVLFMCFNLTLIHIKISCNFLPRVYAPSN